MRKIVEPPHRAYRCISASMYWGQMTTEQPDEVDDKEFLEPPWTISKASSRPCAIKRWLTSVLTFLHLLIKIPYWLILLAGKGIKRLWGG